MSLGTETERSIWLQLEQVTFVSTAKASRRLLCKLSVQSCAYIPGNTEAASSTHNIFHFALKKKKQRQTSSLEVHWREKQHTIFALNLHTLKPVCRQRHDADDFLWVPSSRRGLRHQILRLPLFLLSFFQVQFPCQSARYHKFLSNWHHFQRQIT